MLSNERLQYIAKYVQENRFVDIKSLSEILNISEKTIRLDLNKLQDMGILTRVYGGAQANSNENYTFHSRQGENTEQKIKIAKEAYKLIENGDVIYLDDGSTTIHLANLLVDKQITVLTADVGIVNTLAPYDNITLYIIGGKIRRTGDTLITTGYETIRSISGYHINKLFIGTTAIDNESGLMIFYDENRTYKRALLDNSDVKICIADSSKFNKKAFSYFASFSDLDYLITDSGISKETEETIKNKVNLIIAQ